uniref:Immunoglobulin V-set domain-containing protein n=1 Tax=Neovison vison TaxID=452646 RepID=A0A8C6ZYV9_NEOVI
MGLFLLLSLLLLPSRLQAGRSAECDLNNYGIKQPDRLSAPQGGSIRIPFSFYHGWQLAKDPRVSVALRQTHFHGEIIYNSTQPFIHNDYKNRIAFELSLGQRSGSLQISNLQEKDGNMYFCRIQVETLRCGRKVWQDINGTKLTITPGLKTNARAVPNGSFQNTEEKYENIGIKRQQTEPRLEPKLEPKDDNPILYASLTLSSSSSQAAPPHLPPKEAPQEETLYSLVKA